MKEEETGTEEQDNEFDAAFAERAVISEATQEPGELGSSDDATGERSLPEGFDDAADTAAFQTQEDDAAAKKLAEQEAEIERLRQSEKSQKGRVAALNKKLAEQRAATKPPEPKQEGDTPGEDGEDWEEFQREFPEMAAIVDKRLSNVASKFDQVSSKFDAVAERVDKVSSTAETLVEGEISDYREKQITILRDNHKDLDEVKASPEFAAWRQSAPEDIQEKIRSHHADDADAALKAFKEQTGWKKETSEVVKDKSEVERINERRAAALKKSTGISSKKVGHSPRKDTESDDEFDTAFAAGARKKEKERSYRY